MRVLALLAATTACASLAPPVNLQTTAPEPVAVGELRPVEIRTIWHQGMPAESAFVVPAAVNGVRFNFVVDHGSTTEAATSALLDSLHLTHLFAAVTRAAKVGLEPGKPATLDSTATLRIAVRDTVFEYWGDVSQQLMVDSLLLGQSLQRPVLFSAEMPNVRGFDGILGLDILSQFDIAFDVSARSVRLYARVDGGQAGVAPRWLPPGVTSKDCLRARVVAQPDSVQSTRLPKVDSASATDRERLRNLEIGIRRMLSQTELLLPIEAGGQRIDATFDSGRETPLVNWAAARQLGLTRASPNVRAGLDLGDSVFYASGVELHLAGHPLEPEEIEIMDGAGFDNNRMGDAEPMMLVGWKSFRRRVLFLSYSNSMVCVGGAAS